MRVNRSQTVFRYPENIFYPRPWGLGEEWCRDGVAGKLLLGNDGRGWSGRKERGLAAPLRCILRLYLNLWRATVNVALK